MTTRPSAAAGRTDVPVGTPQRVDQDSSPTELHHALCAFL